jgi:hypothetical protein
MRIGVTGHRKVERTEALVAALREQIRSIQEEIVGSKATPVLLAVVSQLAEGADRLVVDEVFAPAAARGEEARLEVILPMPRAEYEEAQGFSSESAADFERLLERASWMYEPPPADPATDDEDGPGRSAGEHNAYRAAGRQLLARCDVLIALWDGERSGGKGGTADTLLEASWRRRPCIWISTAADLAVEDNLLGLLDKAHAAREAALFLAITLPAASAALGALATVAQHRALKERSVNMKSNLVVALDTVLEADETQLGPASMDAARMISSETGDWMGAMWFLDVEHI